jgi:hypothetical protein
MITKIKVKSGFAKELPMLKKVVKFKPGLNILWGSNGCGKTTALQLLAAHSLCSKGGWTRLLEPVEAGGLNTPSLTFKSMVTYTSPGKCLADVEWDIVPAFFANGLDSGTVDASSGSVIGGDGFTDWQSELSEKMTHRSSGERRRHKLNAFLSTISSAPDFKDVRIGSVNSTWQKCFELQLEVLKNRPGDGRTTVLMDEPERHLDLAAVKHLWGVIIPHITKHAQVIVASHHPLALTSKGAHWIEAVKGQAEADRSIYAAAFGGH